MTKNGRNFVIHRRRRQQQQQVVASASRSSDAPVAAVVEKDIPINYFHLIAETGRSRGSVVRVAWSVINFKV